MCLKPISPYYQNMRSIWKGSISFGLVNIPVRLYSATEDRGIDLDMLHEKDKSPIRYARICTKEGKEVPWEEVIKGYQYQEGDYVVLTAEDFKKADVQKTKTIDILDFAEESEIDSRYFRKPYYLEPENGAEKPYVLLRESLRQSGKIGIAKFVLRNKEHLGAVKPQADMIILNQLRYESELRPTDELHIPEYTKVSNREVEMALALIDQLTRPFRISDYKDEYTEALIKIISEKAKGKPVRARGREPVPTKIPDLMAALKASIEQEKPRRTKARHTRRKEKVKAR
jgi:DNA end-binding protein Ku